jgi:RNA polymerase sigma-70 factor (ECF subfamily)
MSNGQGARSRDGHFRDEALPHLDDVARYALSLTRDEANADDLVQETFLLAYRHWDQFIPGSQCRAWLFAICRNTHLRSARREERVIACEDAELEALGAAALHASAVQSDLGDLFDQLDVLPALRLALDDLPDQFRDVVTLVDVEDQSYDDAARVLGVPKGTVRSRLFRARRLLQERLIEYARDVGIGAHDPPRERDGDQEHD